MLKEVTMDGFVLVQFEIDGGSKNALLALMAKLEFSRDMNFFATDNYLYFAHLLFLKTHFEKNIPGLFRANKCGTLSDAGRAQILAHKNSLILNNRLPNLVDPQRSAAFRSDLMIRLGPTGIIVHLQ